MASWSARDARAKFCELVRVTLKHGPQMITRRGVETVVFVSIEEWWRMQQAGASN